MTCKRCKVLMYPNETLPGGRKKTLMSVDGPRNHKPGHCADGGPVRLLSKIPWPQPAGIFTDGSQFHIIPFLRKVQELYLRCIEHTSEGAPLSFEDLEVELQAFAHMLIPRLITTTGAVERPAFELFDGIDIADDQLWAEHIYEEGEKKYLRLDCLRDAS